MTDIADVYEELRNQGHVIEVQSVTNCDDCKKAPGQYHDYRCSHFNNNRRRKLVYMMHPLGNASNRERNRTLACLWQAAVQEAHPEWLVLAPWIGLSGAWSEARRELGMQVDKATIDVCDMGIITGPLDGGKEVIGNARPGDATFGQIFADISPGMACEVQHFMNHHPQKKILDLRKEFKIELPSSMSRQPLYAVGENVYVENKPGGVCRVIDVDEQAHGIFRYLIQRTEEFFAHEQALKRAQQPVRAACGASTNNGPCPLVAGHQGPHRS